MLAEIHCIAFGDSNLQYTVALGEPEPVILGNDYKALEN
jgi:hypothetical protein